MNDESITLTSNRCIRLPEPDVKNITVLTENLPNEPILPWHHYDSPWLADQQTIAPPDEVQDSTSEAMGGDLAEASEDEFNQNPEPGVIGMHPPVMVSSAATNNTAINNVKLSQDPIGQGDTLAVEPDEVQ